MNMIIIMIDTIMIVSLIMLGVAGVAVRGVGEAGEAAAGVGMLCKAPRSACYSIVQYNTVQYSIV